MSTKGYKYGGGSGSAPVGNQTTNFVSIVKPAVGFSNLLTNLLDTRVGLVVTQSLRNVTNAVFGNTVTSTVSGSAVPTAAPGIWLGMSLYRQSDASDSAPALQITRTTYDVVATRTIGTAAGFTFAGRNDWTNPANASGSPNGTVASFAGNTLGARSGGVSGAFGTFAGKTDMTITRVELRFYVSTSNDVDLRIGYANSSGVQTELEDVVGQVSNLSTPRTYNLTSVINGVWSDIPIKIASGYVTASTATLNTATASFDAAELVVTATQTVIQ